MISVEFIKLNARAIVPTNAYGNDAGFDLHVLDETPLEPGEFAYLPSGIALALPEGYYARVIGRSSAISKRGILVVEGTIDAGFRGEQLTGALNVNNHRVVVQAGMSLAQIVVQPVLAVEFLEVEQLSASARGTNGFGSSGR